MTIRGPAALLLVVVIGAALGIRCSGSSAKRLAEFKPDAQPPCNAFPRAQSNACIVVDADPSVAGLQQVARVPRPGSSFSVDIVLASAGDDVDIGAFNVALRYDGSWLQAQEPQAAAEVAQQVTADVWSCEAHATPRDSAAPIAQASINCLSKFVASRRGPALAGSRKLATVAFSVVGSGTSRLTLSATAGVIAQAGAADIASVTSCNPSTQQQGGGCLNATVSNAEGAALPSDLALESGVCKEGADGPVCQGTVRNVGQISQGNLVVIIFFYRADGSPVAGDGIALQPDGLRRNEKGSFKFTAKLPSADAASWRIAFEHDRQGDEILWRDDRHG